MTVIALALAAVLAGTVATFASLVRSLIRQHARERDLLINQLLHAAGNAWQPPPAAEVKRPDRDEPAQVRFTPSPEQFPVT